MKNTSLADYLEHMKEASADACAFIEDFREDDFYADKRTQRAVS